MTMPAPLAGLRVIEVAQGVCGPFAGQTLADLGAHVVKVETTTSGDASRLIPPAAGTESDLFLAYNRNKESLALDVTHADGRATLRALIERADVVVTDFSARTAAPLGLDAAFLRSLYPGLIHCSLTGFGSDFPDCDWRACDLLVQAEAGTLYVTGEKGRASAKMGLPFAEAVPGLFAAISVLAALERRARDGVGAEIDIAMFDTSLAMLSYMADIYFATGSSPRALGSAHPTIYPYNAFQTADGHIVAAPFTQAFWRKFAVAIGREDLPDRAEFKNFAERIRNRATLAPILDGVMRTQSTAHWLQVLDTGDVPNGPVNTVADAVEMAQTNARGMIVATSHAELGSFRSIASPLRLTSETGASFVPPHMAAPLLGAHTVSILQDLLEMDPDHVERLRRAGVIRQHNQVATTAGATWTREPTGASAAPTASDVPPLAGLRVLDLTRMLAGPYAGLLLADLGAEVIKIEEPRLGDPTRRNIPMLGGESTYFMAVNRGKQSVTLDLKSSAGRQALLRLVENADVVVENYRPGVMGRLGLSYDDLKRVNPHIILCSISGYGQTGPLRDKISFDLVNQAMAGTMSMTGEPGRPPVRVGLPIGDLSGGIFGALAVLAALRSRRRTGHGASIDLGLHELLVALLGRVGQRYLSSGSCPGPLGAGHETIAPHGVFRTQDGVIALVAGDAAAWQRLLSAMDAARLGHDPRFATMADRKIHETALNAAMEVVFVTRTRADWLTRLRDAGVAAAPLRSVGEALESPHATARGMVFAVEHPTVGALRTVGTPLRVDGRHWRSHAPSPTLGQHNDIALVAQRAKG